MSISSTINRNTYVGNGAVNQYSYTFKIFDQDDLKVVVLNNTTNVETTLTIATDYTVDGVKDTSGGSITLVDSGQAWIDGGNLSSDYNITIRRVVDLTQLTDIRNQGDFFPEVHEDTFDKLVMADQQQQDDIDRSVKLPESVEPSNFDPTLPTDIEQVSKSIVTNPTSDGLVMGPTVDEIANAQGYAEDADDHRITAERWAIKIDGSVVNENTMVDSGEYSSKAYSVGGIGVTDIAGRGASKEWATKVSGTVDTVEYSAKEHAQGLQTRGVAGGGSSKDWSNYIGGTVDDTEFSSKKYAQDSAQSAIDAANAAAASQWTDVRFVAFADSPIAVVEADSGTLFSVDTSGGNVVFNLPQISGLTLTNPWSIGVKKTTNDANEATVNPFAGDQIDGGSSTNVTRYNGGKTLLPDADPAPDEWTSVSWGETPIDGDIVGTTDTQTMTNKTFDDEITIQQISTPINPPSGYNKIYFKADGSPYTLDSSGNEQPLGGGGGGSKNYFTDVDAEIDSTIGNWETDDGVGGASAGLTLSVTAVAGELLAGTNSLKLVKDAADRNGHFIKVGSETIDPSDRGRPNYGSFEFRPGTGYVGDDLIFEVYDVTNAVVLYSGKATDLTLLNSKGRFDWVSYLENNTAQVEFRIKINNTNTNGFDAFFDEFKFGPVAVLSAPIITEWQSFTPTSNWTNTTLNAKYRRVGDSVELEYFWTTSAVPVGGNFNVSLPAGLVIDTAKMPTVSGDYHMGQGTYTDAGTNEYPIIATYSNTTSVDLRFHSSNTTNPVTSTFAVTPFSPFAAGASDFGNFRVKVPIVGWASGAVMSANELSHQTIDVAGSGNAGTAITANVTDIDFIEIRDSHGTWATNQFTAPKTGKYMATGQILITPATSIVVSSYINGVADKLVGYDPTSIQNYAFTWEGELQKDDILTFRSSGGVTLLNTASQHWIEITSLPDFTTLGAVHNVEVIEASSGLTNYTIPASTWGDLTSIDLGAGTWDITAIVYFYNNGGVTAGTAQIGVSTNSGNDATGLVLGSNSGSTNIASTSTLHTPLPNPTYTVTHGAETTYYLKAFKGAAITNQQVYYKIHARRV